MQTYALTIDKFMDHAAKWSPDREVVTAETNGARSRIGYAVLRDRANRLSGALVSLGLHCGDRVATLAWNTQNHLEMYYAVMGAGFVCHTLNPRLTATHLAAMINEAEDCVLAVAANLTALAAELTPLCPTLKHTIVLDTAPEQTAYSSVLPQVWTIETLLQSCGAAVAWGAFGEESEAGLCYTSGTTGKPKGVVYTHRSNYLHTLRALQADATAFTGGDCILAAVPLFHANAWGIPFAAPAVGAKLVLPNRDATGAALAALMREERVTVAAGVHTVWLGVLDHLDQVGGDLPDLKRVLIGGSKCPDALLERMEKRLGAFVQTSWGMTELSPLGTIAPIGTTPVTARASGKPPLGLDLKLTDAEGQTLPQQRDVVGRLWAKGASVMARYFKADDDALDAQGFFDTGDLAMIDEGGNLSICGRSKDLIKSGGEWINPAEIEEIVGRHPAVGLVAVIARNDDKWGERPVLIVEPRQGECVDTQGLLSLLRGKVADWWIPEQVVQIAAMPLAGTGKIDKSRLRSDFASGRIATDSVRR